MCADGYVGVVSFTDGEIKGCSRAPTTAPPTADTFVVASSMDISIPMSNPEEVGTVLQNALADFLGLSVDSVLIKSVTVKSRRLLSSSNRSLGAAVSYIVAGTSSGKPLKGKGKTQPSDAGSDARSSVGKHAGKALRSGSREPQMQRAARSREDCSRQSGRQTESRASARQKESRKRQVGQRSRNRQAAQGRHDRLAEKSQNRRLTEPDAGSEPGKERRLSRATGLCETEGMRGLGPGGPRPDATSITMP